MQIPTKSDIHRDGMTWLMYLMLGYYAFVINQLGPIVPFVRGELGLSYTVSSFHFSAFAVGMLIAGLITDRILTAFGYWRTFWAGIILMSVLTFGLLFGTSEYVTIGSVFLMGVFGSTVAIIIPVVLSAKYHDKMSVAVSEANALASFLSMAGPLAVGLFVRCGMGWRWAPIPGIVFALLLLIVFIRTPFPDLDSAAPERKVSQGVKKRLPGGYWLIWFIVLASVSAEFCMIYWSSTYLEDIRGLSKANAALTLMIYLGAMGVGRIVSSKASMRFRPSFIVSVSAGIAFAGFLMNWLIPWIPAALFGLFLAGFGIASFYPQTLSRAVRYVDPELEGQASARCALAGGLAIFSMPLILGWLADVVSLERAYALVGVVLFVVWLLNHLSRSLTQNLFSPPMEPDFE